MAGRQRLQGRRRRPALQGPAGPGEEPQDHLRRGHGPAGRPDRRRGRRAARTRAGTSCSPPARYPSSLPGLEIDGERVITSDHALKLDTRPASVVVLGGGVIGCEFASVWRSFGAEVTIVEALPHLVPLEDEAASKLLERAFRKRGIGFELGARFAGVERTENGRQGLPRERQDPRGRPAAGRRRPRPGLRRSSATRRSASRWSAASSRSTRTARPTSRRSPRSATSSRPCSSPTSASARASSSPSGSPASTRRRSTTTASRGSPTPTRGRLGRPHRGAGQGEVRRRRRRDPHLRPGRQRQEPDPQDRRLRQAGPPEGRPGGRRPHGRQPGRRARRRGPADLQLGGLPRRGRPA